MACAAGPDIKEDGLVLALDAANTKSILSAVEVLVVAGGGGGGGVIGGGGGAGGFRTETAFPITPGSAITVTVGDGGSGGFSWNSGSQRGNPGTDSIFSTITATGGGGGGAHGGADNRTNGTTGGSGGGGGSAAGSAGNTPSTTPSQGNGGGTGDGNHGGGGGGSSANGETRVSGVRGGNGGNGTSSSISGTLVTYAGGGAGGARSGSGRVGGTGGSGGGGNGGTTDLSRSSTHGGTNTGGGGGGGGHNGSGSGAVQSGSNGGSGIVIVRYPGSQRASGGTVTFVAGHTIHTFTTSGTFTPNGAPGTGTIWTDFSNNGNTGTLTNGPTYSSANGGSIVFDGVNDYVDLGSDKVFKTTGGWTVESWVNYDVIPTTYNNTTSPANFIGSETITHNSWYWSVLESKLSLWNRSPGVWKHGSTILQAYTWYNAVLVCYNSGTSYQMYLNGIAEGGDHTAYSWNASYSGLNIRYIGRGNSTNVRLVDGKIPITKVYDRALTAQEIQQNFNATRSRFSI